MGTKVQETVRESKILSSSMLLYPTWGVGEEYGLNTKLGYFNS